MLASVGPQSHGVRPIAILCVQKFEREIQHSLQTCENLEDLGLKILFCENINLFDLTEVNTSIKQRRKCLLGAYSHSNI